MSNVYSLVIRNGTVVDGLGGAAYVADVAVIDGRIAAVGEVEGCGFREIDATGLLVTPGFVDIHTHYDGQVTWEDRMLPSSVHGVTTVVMGNCGVGFAPCRPEDRDKLVDLLEGVEDIPGIVMTEGLPWTWETFPEYLDAIEAKPHDVDIAAQLPHSCLRVYVMGQRGIDREDATSADLAEMTRLTREALEAGALGFATSRSVFHRDRNGVPIPSKDVVEAELMAVAAGMKDAGHGVIEALIDYEDIESEFGLLRKMAIESGRPLSFTVNQVLHQPTAWVRALELIDDANAEGVRIKGQVIGRPTGVLMGLELSLHPFLLRPAYQEVAVLPLAERVIELRKFNRRARILSEEPGQGAYKIFDFLDRFDQMFQLGDPPDYAPPPEASIAAIARRQGLSPEEIAYDMLLEQGGRGMIFLPITNYADGNLDAVTTMLKNEHVLLGLGDGGAHYGSVCDASMPTFMLTYWTRDKDGDRLSVPAVVKALTYDAATAVGLEDRGRIAPGYKADVNVIDYQRLRLFAPEVVFDLPAATRRIIQNAEGFIATILSGEVTYDRGVFTGVLPGKLVRGPQAPTTKQVSDR